MPSNIFFSLKDFPKFVAILSRNVPFIFLTFAGTTDLIIASSLATFSPKIIESLFKITKSQSSLIVGMYRYHKLIEKLLYSTRPLVREIAIGAEGLEFDSRAGQMDTVSPKAHPCDVSLELYRPGIKSRRWTPPLVTRFGVIPRADHCILKI